jgi:hypothetical protein
MSKTTPLENLLAHQAITELLGQYVAGVDRGEPERTAGLFGEHGVLEVHGGREYAGRDGVREFLSGSRIPGAMNAFGRIRHHVSSLVIELDSPESATASSYFLAVSRIGPDHWGTYRDELEARDGSWSFRRRQVTIEGASPEGWIGSGAGPVSFE